MNEMQYIQLELDLIFEDDNQNLITPPIHDEEELNQFIKLMGE